MKEFKVKNDYNVQKMMRVHQEPNEAQPLTMNEVALIIREHFKNDLFKITREKDADFVTVKLRTGVVKRYSYTGIKLLQLFNEKVKRLQSFRIDENYTGTVSIIEREGKTTKYSFYISRNGEPCIYSYFYNENPMKIEDIKQRIRLLFHIREIKNYEGVDPDTIID